MRQIDSILPDYLKAPPRPTEVPVSPDSTSSSNIVRPSLPMEQDSGADSTQIAESPDPDLACSELLSNDSTLCTEGSEDESGYFGASSNSAEKGITTTKQRSDSGETSSSSGSRSSSPLSAVDIFTDFSTNVLQRAYAEVEAAAQQAASPVDPTYTILVS